MRPFERGVSTAPKHRWVLPGQVQTVFDGEIHLALQELLMKFSSTRNTVSLLKCHGWLASTGLFPMLLPGTGGLTTFSSLLVLTIVSAVDLERQFGSQKLNLSLSLCIPATAVSLSRQCSSVWLPRGRIKCKEVQIQYLNILSHCTGISRYIHFSASSGQEKWLAIDKKQIKCWIVVTKGLHYYKEE